MLEKKYQPGEVIFKEGDPSEYAIRILSGNVEIVKEVNDQTIVLGIAGKDEIVGEMGILEGTTRNATALAKDNLNVLLVDEKEFMKMVGETPKLSKHLLNRLSARLRVTSQELAEARTANEDANTERFLDFGNLDAVTEVKKDTADLVLSSNTSELAEQMPGTGIPVRDFPFIIGRKPDDHSDRQQGSVMVHLQLDDSSPFRLSRVHFMIQRAKGVFVLRDLGSALGTCVNGQFMGVDFSRDSVKLEAGENTIIAGGAESPFSFKLNIPNN